MVTPQLGVDSQTWILRQISGFTRVTPRVLCWECNDVDSCQLDGIEVTVVPFPRDPMMGFSRHVHRLRNLKNGNFYGSVGAERNWLTQLAVKDQPCAILCHFGHMGLRMLPIAETAAVPLVTHFHGLDLSSALRNRWYRWSLRPTLLRFAAVVVVGSHQERLVLGYGMPAHKISRIPCGVPVSRYVPAVHRHRDTIRFICVSRLTRFKGVDYSIKAFAEVARTMRNVELSVVGDGPERENLEALVSKLNVKGRVTFWGSISDRDVQVRLQESDVFLQHSVTGPDGWVEGFGVSISEASASSLPVVVTDCGGITDQVVHNETGFVVKQRDVVGMADAMRRLARDSALRGQLGHNGRNRMLSHFDTAVQILKLENVLLKAAGGPLVDTSRKGSHSRN